MHTYSRHLPAVTLSQVKPATDPLPQPGLTIQRKVSSRGGIQVARQRIQAGMTHAGQTVTIQLADTTVRVIDQHGELIAAAPRNGTGEISRFKAYGTRRSP
jgi:translation elongation factor EF-1alpha